MGGIQDDEILSHNVHSSILKAFTEVGVHANFYYTLEGSEEHQLVS